LVSVLDRPKVDEIDRQIIAILQGNAREPIASLARKVRLSRSAVQERLARLERNRIITGYTLRLSRDAPRAAVSAYLLLYLEGPICERLARLERNRIITGYTLRLSRDAPRAAVSAYLLLYLEGPICERVAPPISRILEVKKSQSISGEIDMILQVEADSLERLNEVRNQVEAIHGVRKVTTGIVLADRFDRTR